MSTNQSREKRKNFWSGYALGAVTASMVAYAFGTRKGREKVRKAIDVVDSYGDVSLFADEMLDVLQSVLSESAGDDKSRDKVDINDVISKIKSIAKDGKKNKKFFVTADKY
jgi:hypothetical protein